MNDFLRPLSDNLVHHNAKTKTYPDGSFVTTVCSVPCFRDREATIKRLQDDILEQIRLIEHPDREEENSPERERTEEWLRVVRDKVRDIVLMNDFKYFLTITIDPEKIDSFDVFEVHKKLNKWLKNQVTRKGLQYVLIPEYHKSGRIHAHALINDVFKLEDSGIKTKSGKVIYNVPEWRYGFTTAIPLDSNKVRLSNYVTKYITKGSEKIFGKYFWSS